MRVLFDFPEWERASRELELLPTRRRKEGISEEELDVLVSDNYRVWTDNRGRGMDVWRKTSKWTECLCFNSKIFPIIIIIIISVL